MRVIEDLGQRMLSMFVPGVEASAIGVCRRKFIRRTCSGGAFSHWDELWYCEDCTNGSYLGTCYFNGGPC
ncbi:hypothetical protein [Actinocorallia longicatena]|uniref:Uncharacterized protein n=1 Tax=Actinocorallia longicatena TaxID=111803 RepID=A0ABP6Q8X5_9ACTN